MTKAFIVARHVSEGRVVLAVCDSEIHGRKYEDSASILDLTSKFYSGEEKSPDDVETLMLKAYLINAVGKNSVDIAIRLGLAERADIRTIAGIPYTHVLVL